ncbi:MAG: prepilin-type N-terminal cleavage/methylation domain-containing protein [Planctomycetota bacterium]
MRIHAGQHGAGTRRREAGRAFTLTELLIVIAILAVVVLVGLPAFASMLRGSERTLAENQLRSGMQAAQTAAVGRGGADTAAVFFYEPGAFENGGRTSILPCEFVGRIIDTDALGNDVERDVFAPFGGAEPVQLPPGWMVRGFAAPSLIHDQVANPNGWYEPTANRIVNPKGGWVFPETAFYDQDPVTGLHANDTDLVGSVTARQTFMVRFEGGSGVVKSNNPGPVVVIAPRPASTGAATRAPGAVNLWRRPDLADKGLSKWARAVINRPIGTQSPGSPPMSDAFRRQLIGDESGDTVLACSVDVTALYNESKLAEGLLTSGLNKSTGSLYAKPGLNSVPLLDSTLWTTGFSAQTAGTDIDNWIMGKLQRNGQYVESDAMIFAFDRLSAKPREIKP